MRLRIALGAVSALCLCLCCRTSWCEERSVSPNDTEAPDRADRNARAYLFRLEFGLGGPLPLAQERAVLQEIRKSWAVETPEQAREHDEYPALVEEILETSDGDVLERLRRRMQDKLVKWADAGKGRSRAAAIVDEELKRRTRVLVAGDPPLTVMAASAISEMLVYSALLQSNAEATPDQIPATAVQEVMKSLGRQWPTLDSETRQTVCQCPAIWMCSQKLLTRGSKQQREAQRQALVRLAQTATKPETSPSGAARTSGRGQSGGDAVDKAIKHSVLMNIQQQTFNTYMRSQGHSYHPVYGKY